MTHSKVFCSQYISYLHDYSLAFPSIISLSTLVNKHLSGISSNCLCLSCHNYKVWCQCDVHIHVCECVCVCVCVCVYLLCVYVAVFLRWSLFAYLITLLSCLVCTGLNFEFLYILDWLNCSDGSKFLPKATYQEAKCCPEGGRGFFARKWPVRGGKPNSEDPGGVPWGGGLKISRFRQGGDQTPCSTMHLTKLRSKYSTFPHHVFSAATHYIDRSVSPSVRVLVC